MKTGGSSMDKGLVTEPPMSRTEICNISRNLVGSIQQSSNFSSTCPVDPAQLRFLHKQMSSTGGGKDPHFDIPDTQLMSMQNTTEDESLNALAACIDMDSIRREYAELEKRRRGLLALAKKT